MCCISKLTSNFLTLSQLRIWCQPPGNAPNDLWQTQQPLLLLTQTLKPSHTHVNANTAQAANSRPLNASYSGQKSESHPVMLVAFLQTCQAGKRVMLVPESASWEYKKKNAAKSQFYSSAATMAVSVTPHFVTPRRSHLEKAKHKHAQRRIHHATKQSGLFNFPAYF